MDSDTIGKIEKAVRYAHEPERFEFQTFSVKVRGDHSTHAVVYNQQGWSCTCEFFGTHGNCSHTIALEKVLGVMLPGAIPSIMAGK
jgi:hypothetical protein